MRGFADYYTSWRMRLVALLLLAGNIIYLGWELDREAKALAANSSPALITPAGTTVLEIIDDGTGMPELKSSLERSRPTRVLLPVRRQP